jgi:biotin operon repressor
MSENSSRPLLISILVIAVANLVASAMQIGLSIQGQKAGGTTTTVESLPASYTESEIALIARKVTEPFNRGDLDGLYANLDDLAKNQLSMDQLKEQIGKLRALVGTSVQSASYSGFHILQNDGGLKLIQLDYVVKLSGAQVSSGIMQIKVIDRPSGAGIVGFFINGRTQQ